MTHFLQSPAWAAFQESLGRTVITDHGDGWSYLAVVEKGRLGNRLYCPYGPAADSPAALTDALTSLKAHAKELGVDFIRVEPTGSIVAVDLQKSGYQQQASLHLQPQDTQIIDLTVPKNDIIAAMSQNNRNIYRNFHKKGLSIVTSQNPDDIDYFLTLIHKVADRNGITPHSDDYFRKQAASLFPSGAGTLYLAKLESQVVAAAIAFDGIATRYYAHAAADDEFRKLSAGTALLGHMITDAKDAGKQAFDLYGIAPADSPNHPWAGFTKFKKSFGGHEHHFVGLWEFPVKPWRYLLYRLLLALKRRLG